LGWIHLQVKLSARISPGALPRSVVVWEAESVHATWVIFDRFVFRELLHVAPAAGVITRLIHTESYILDNAWPDCEHS
jgi:hypothetical protein